MLLTFNAPSFELLCAEFIINFWPSYNSPVRLRLPPLTMAARIRIPLREHRTKHPVMLWTLMNNYLVTQHWKPFKIVSAFIDFIYLL